MSGSWVKKLAVIVVTAGCVWWFVRDHEAKNVASDCACPCEADSCGCVCFEPALIVGAVVRR